jgi:hypothetical protein
MSSSQASAAAGKRKSRSAGAATTDAAAPAISAAAAAPATATTSTCVVCMEALTAGDATFVGPCKHVFHVQCAERNFVIGGATSCPCCRAPFEHAPGFVAMARTAAQQQRQQAAAAAAAAAAGGGFVPSPPPPPARRARVEEAPAAMADVAPPAAPPAPFALAPDFARASVVMDVHWVPSGTTSTVTCLLTLKFKDDEEEAPMTVPTDFVLLADVSGSMSGSKISSVRDALLKLSDMFGPADRVALVAFNHRATQLTALAPLRGGGAEVHAAAFRRAAMTGCTTDGGTDICAALACAERILAARAHRNPAAQVLLLTDGQDSDARSAGAPPGATLTTLGFGADHDAELLASLASRSRPRGTFTFVSQDDMLDETMAAYVGDVTRVLTLDARLEVTAAPGTRVTRILAAPGEAAVAADGGGVSVALGAARVNDSVDVLLELQVSSPDAAASFETLRVAVSGAATDDSGAVVRTPPLVVSFAAAAAAAGVAPEAAEALAAAQNRQQLALAAATIAAAAENYPQLAEADGDDDDEDDEAAPGAGAAAGAGAGAGAAAQRLNTGDVATSVIAAARSLLRGSAAARAPAEAELAELAAGVRDARSSRIAALEAAHAATAQRSLMGRTGTGKGGGAVRYTMKCRKSAGY